MLQCREHRQGAVSPAAIDISCIFQGIIEAGFLTKWTGFVTSIEPTKFVTSIEPTNEIVLLDVRRYQGQGRRPLTAGHRCSCDGRTHRGGNIEAEHPSLARRLHIVEGRIESVIQSVDHLRDSGPFARTPQSVA